MQGGSELWLMSKKMCEAIKVQLDEYGELTKINDALENRDIMYVRIKTNKPDMQEEHSR